MALQLRTTERSMSLSALANLQGNLSRLGNLQSQLSSGKLLSRPSDSPSGTVAAMQARGDIARVQQYGRNADDGLGWLGTVDSTLSGGVELLHAARDLVVQGLSPGSAGTAQTALALADQVDGIRRTMLDIGNTTYLGRPVFGGTTSGRLAYDPTGAYVGDAGRVLRTVGDGVQVRVDSAGPAVFGSGPSQIFAVLTAISDDLRGNPGNLNADLGQLDTGINAIQSAQSNVGARYNQVQMMQQAATTKLVDLKSQLSNVEDIDLPATITELQMQQVAYQAALSATSHVIQQSLVDFLK
jgi:flagellar hook-associated protein 3 FlgL